MIEYMVKVWCEHELSWQFIIEDMPGLYKSVRGPHIKNKLSKIHPMIVSWAKYSEVSIDQVMYAVVPLQEYLENMRRQGKNFDNVFNNARDC